MALRTSHAAKGSLYGRLRNARLLEMSEGDFERELARLQSNPLFQTLLKTGAVSLSPFERAGFASRRFGGWGLRTATEGFQEALDARGEVVALIQRVGQERFERYFLGEDTPPVDVCAQACGISPEEASRLRKFVDRLYVQSEFEQPSAETAPAKTYSPVAGIVVSEGKAALGFFNREIWKGRYRLDKDKVARLRAAVSPKDAQLMDGLLRQLDFLEQRKTTLYRALEILLREQSDYLRTGDPDRRKPLTQRRLALELDATPSVLSRLIATKSVELPWGLEAPMKALLPSSKAIMRDRLYALALNQPESSDDHLRAEMARLFGAKLSRRSIAQYRKDLGLGGQGRRAR